MIAMHPHQPVYASREAAWQGCALTQVAGTDRRVGRSSAFLGLLDSAAIKLSNAKPGGALP
jgi:hypothetical protein